MDKSKVDTHMYFLIPTLHTHKIHWIFQIPTCYIDKNRYEAWIWDKEINYKNFYYSNARAKKKNLRLESSSIGHYYVETLTANINEVSQFISESN